MHEINKSLLVEYHAGRATPLQIKLIETWLKEPGHEQVFYQALFEWETMHPQYAVDVETALEQYRRVMDGDKSTTKPSQPGSGRWVFQRPSFSGWLVAASVLLALMAGLWLFREPIIYRTYVTTYGQVRPVQLPDGSRVVLNANSTLRFARFGFGEQDREVVLNGEAEFSVTHTLDNRRFIVKTNRNVKVEVLGTEFVVFTRERATRVVLTKGKVKLHYQRLDQPAQQLTMLPGEQVTVNERGLLAVKASMPPAAYSSWKKHQFTFNDTPLREIGAMITDNYGLKVDILNPQLADRKVSGEFEATNADELLQVLRELLGVNIERQRNRILISEPIKK